MSVPNPMALRFSHISLAFIPNIGTPAYVLLSLLNNGEYIERWQPSLGEAIRSALQRLKGDKLGNWLVKSIKVEGKKHSVLMLDPRHLSGETEQDAEARRERRKQLKVVSAKEAKQGRIREARAVREMSDAQAEYFMSLGNAANDGN
jgi:hypothetical protein